MRERVTLFVLLGGEKRREEKRRKKGERECLWV